MRRLSVFVKKLLGDRLISEEKEKTLIFMADKYRLISLPCWRSHDRAWRLSTPYGKLAIWGFDAGTGVLQRQANGVQDDQGNICEQIVVCGQINSQNIFQMVIQSVALDFIAVRKALTAKAAAICHVSENEVGAGSSQIGDGCCWEMRHSTCSTTIPAPAPNPNNGEPGNPT